MEIIKKNNYVSPVIVLPNDSDPKEQKYKAWQTLRDNGMTINQVAQMFGVSTHMVYNHTETRYDWRATNSGNAARMAKEQRMGYYIPLMLELRKLGYSNADIGVKTGFCVTTIREYIGRQPDETTLASYRAAGAKRRFRNIAVKNQLARDESKPIPAVAKVLESA